MNERLFESVRQEIEENHTNITGMIIQKGDKRLYEHYFNDCHQRSTIHVYSISKSILSLLFGIAQQEGYIEDLEGSILSYFPNHQVKNEDLQKITVKNLLTMTTPYKAGFPPFTYLRYFMSHDWTKFTLKRLAEKPIGQFNYTPLVGPDILSAILAQSTGQSPLEFAQKKLFAPLGIHVEKAIYLKTAKEQVIFNKSTTTSGWVVDATGLNAGGWGLTLATDDLLKIGQLILNKGKWHGVPLIPEEWLNEMQQPHSYWAKEQLDYGYLWWIIDKSKPIIAAMGDGGNVLYIDQEQEVVIAITALFKENVTDRLSFIQQTIMPLIETQV